MTGGRTVKVFASFVRGLLDGRYKDAEKAVLVMGQPNPHAPASPYALLPPDEAKRLAERLEVRHTPGSTDFGELDSTELAEVSRAELPEVKHGSWLNMAEIELSALARDPPERVGDEPGMTAHVSAWESRRNGAKVMADWQFTTGDARIKLRKLYPTVDG